MNREFCAAWDGLGALGSGQNPSSHGSVVGDDAFRSMAGTEKWLLVANEESDTVAVFERDETTGRLAESGKTFPQARPQCLVFA